MKDLVIKIGIILFIVLCLFPNVCTYAADVDEQSTIINEQLNGADIKGIEQQFNKYRPEDIDKIFPSFDPKTIIKEAASGSLKPNVGSFLGKVLNYCLAEIFVNLNIMVKLMVVVVFCAVLKNLQTSFLSESVGELAFYACYAVIVSIMVVSLNTTMNIGRDLIDNMVAFMHSCVPLLISVMVSTGSVVTGGAMQPIMLMVIEVVASIFKNFLMPMVMLYAVLSIVDNLTDKVQITKLTSFIKQITTWSIGIIMTVFIAIVSIQGTMGAVVDGVSSKTAKFALGTFIPVAGKYLADAADTVLACSLLIKNGAGLLVLIGILSICILPLLKLAAIVIIYRMTCALIEPISEKRITKAINDIAGSMTYILGIGASVSVMLLISVTALISAGTISAMIR